MPTEKNINFFGNPIMTKKYHIYIFTIAIVLLCSFPGFGSVLSENICTPDDSTQRTIIFISDTQTPMWFEKIFVKTHRNNEATDILLDAIASDTLVSSVYLLGDVTAMSSFNSNWVKIDTFIARLNMTDVDVHATPGNHDYLLSSSTGEKHFKQRFPDFNRTGSVIMEGPVAVILLNSNFIELKASEEKRQLDWYTQQLDILEKDTTIKMVIVGCHHSPYTNSVIVNPSKKVREQFVKPFMGSSKSRLFISGHAHTFQYFKDTLVDKHFLVIGGGGGLLHSLSSEKENDLQDQIKWDGKYRMFHFARCTIMPDGFDLKVLMLTDDLKKLECVYNIFIPFDKQ